MLQGGKAAQFAVLRLVSDCNAVTACLRERGIGAPTDTTCSACSPSRGGGEEVN